MYCLSLRKMIVVPYFSICDLCLANPKALAVGLIISKTISANKIWSVDGFLVRTVSVFNFLFRLKNSKSPIVVQLQSISWLPLTFSMPSSAHAMKYTIRKFYQIYIFRFTLSRLSAIGIHCVSVCNFTYSTFRKLHQSQVLSCRNSPTCL